MRLTLDPEPHTYYLDGRVIPGITEIRTALGIGYPHTTTDPVHRERGKAVHRAIELYDNGDLDESSVDPAVAPYLKAYIQFREDTGFEPVHSELMLASERDWYAGTLDKVGRLPSLGLGIVEIKSTESVDMKALKAQLSAQSRLWNMNFPRRPIRWKYGLRLRREGPPSLITCFSETPDFYWLGLLLDFKEAA